MLDGFRQAVRHILGRNNLSPALEGDYLQRLLGKEDPIILEIGCNDGAHTQWFLELFSEARICCFEPDPRARERFRNRMGGIEGKVRLFDVAISDNDGETEFYLSDGLPDERLAKDYPAGWDQSGSIRKPKKHLEVFDWCRFDKTIRVQTRKLDTWCREEGIERVDFIWADVQGAEADLIRGGRVTLEKTRYLYTEYSNDELYEGQLDLKGLLALIPDFRVVCRYNGDVLLTNTRLV
jgi:FkbM family methyltransferase